MLLIVLFVGESAGGAARWISIGGLRIQPAEFTKFAVLIALARYLSAHEMSFIEIKTLIIPFILFLIPLFLVLKQPDLGTSLVLINSEKGKLYYESLDEAITSKQYTMDEALKANQSMTKSLKSVDLMIRDAFFYDLDKYTFDIVAKKYFPMPTMKTHIISFFKKMYRLFIK